MKYNTKKSTKASSRVWIYTSGYAIFEYINYESTRKMNADGFACPFYKELKVQNNTASLLKHMHAKHKGRCDPIIEEMREGAVQHDKDTQCDGHVFETETHHSHSELDVHQAIEMSNSKDELMYRK